MRSLFLFNCLSGWEVNELCLSDRGAWFGMVGVINFRLPSALIMILVEAFPSIDYNKATSGY